MPAVSGSGMIAANSVSLDSIGAQLDVLQKLKGSNKAADVEYGKGPKKLL